MTSAQRVGLVMPYSRAKYSQVLHAAHLVVEQGRMRHVADLLADVAKFAAPRMAIAAARRLAQSRQRAQQSSLARAVIAENGVELPAGKFRGDAAERGKTAKLLDQIRDGDDGAGRVWFQSKG